MTTTSTTQQIDHGEVTITHTNEHIAMEWWCDDIAHRDNGPALLIAYPTGGMHRGWFRHGGYHRTDGGPARSDAHPTTGGAFTWFTKNRQARGNGPAYVTGDGIIEWSHKGALVAFVARGSIEVGP